MKQLWKPACAILAGAALLSACATAEIFPSNTASVEIVDRTEGRVLPVYSHAGHRYVVGKPGNEYAIRVRNTSGERLLAVMSVDGVNVITGDTAAPSQSGYVISPNDSYDIAGWRKSMSRTAAFYFTSLANSYAARTGRPDNVGVIGVAIFRERSTPRLAVPYDELSRKDAKSEARGAAPAQSPAAPAAQGLAAAEPAPSRLGTGHGRNEDSRTSYTNFTRASDTPNETIAFFYDSYETLLAQGVPVSIPPIARAQPDPFPERGRFAPDPR